MSQPRLKTRQWYNDQLCFDKAGQAGRKEKHQRLAKTQTLIRLKICGVIWREHAKGTWQIWSVIAKKSGQILPSQDVPCLLTEWCNKIRRWLNTVLVQGYAHLCNHTILVFIFTTPQKKDFSLFFSWVIHYMLLKVEKALKWFILVFFFYLTESWHCHRGV